MKKTMMALLLFIGIMYAGITFGSGSRVFIYNANINVYGNLKNLGGVITPVSTSKFSFVGSTQDTITNIATFPNLAISKPSGSVRLNNTSNLFQLTGNINFTGGNLITGAGTFELGSAATVTGETATSYIVGTVKAPRAVGTGTSTFGGIGYSINNTGSDLGTVTVYRYSGDGNEVTLYGQEGIWRKWTVQTTNAFTGTRQVTSSWLSNEDNGNTLASLKVWKYETAKSGDDAGSNVLRKIKSTNKDTKKLNTDSESLQIEDDGDIVTGDIPRTLGWVEVDGATFDYASSPRTATYTVNGATSYTICSVSNAFADGAGTESNPYQIATLDQLNAVRNYPAACFIQIADIDASATTGWNSGAGWDPIDNFSGKYNGDGHKVSNLFVNRPSENYIGLFGITSTGSIIWDLGVENVNITGYYYVGGFAGYSRGSIQNCYAKGTVSVAYMIAGGFLGYSTTGSSVNNCYSNAQVTRLTGSTDTNIGSFCGRLYIGTITKCYTTGAVVYQGTTNPTNKGFVGSVGASITMSGNFWNTETTGQTSTSGTASGLTKTQMRTLLTFTNAAWDFQAESVNGTEDLWGINGLLNSGYPFLSWEGLRHRPSPFAGGIGSTDEPFMVSNLTQLDSVRNWMSSSFLQLNDIDASATTGWNAGAGWNAIGSASPYFTGTYDGGGHIISGLYFNRTTNYTGLFGVANTGSTIKNIGLVNMNGTGYNYSGSVASYCNGIMSNCFSTGTLRAYSYIGGFVGYSTTAAVITDCYTKVNISRITGSTSTYTAGFIGRNNQSKIKRSYSTGSVVWEGVTNPTNKGFAGSVTTGGNYEMADNFWDMNTSGQTTTSGTATGKTTAEMRQQTTFVNWDFSTPVWNIHTSLNSGYPYLDWEYRLPVEAPANLALTVSGTDVIITWDPVTNATGYVVYSSADPYGAFALDTSGVFSGAQWTAPSAGTKMFYFVTATNATKSVQKRISEYEMNK